MNTALLFSYKYRRKLDKKIVDYLYDKFKDVPYSSYLIIIIHTIFILFTFTMLFTSDRNSIFYYISFGILICMIFVNFYFYACPITQLERLLLQSKNWFGFPYNLVFSILNLEINKYRVGIMFSIITIGTFLYLVFI